MRKLIFASISTIALLTLAACDDQAPQSGGADMGSPSAMPDAGATGMDTATPPPSTGGATTPAQ